MFDVVYREETLLNVIRSVTRNGRSIILTAVLALILVYLFSIIGYIFFKDDFLIDVDVDDDAIEAAAAPVIVSHMSGGPLDTDQQCPGAPTRPDTPSNVVMSGGDRKERACDSLVMCILTTLNQGLRNGGGIGDILRAPSSTVRGRMVHLLWFYICLLSLSCVCVS